MNKKCQSGIAKVLLKILPICISLLIFFIMFYKIGFDKLLLIIFNINPVFLLLSAILFTLALLLKSVRWYLFLVPVGIHNLSLAIYSYFLGQMVNEVLPTGSGEVARIVLIKDRENIGFMSLVPSIVLERFYDIILLLVLSILLSYTLINAYVLLFLLLLIAGLILVFLKPEVLKIKVTRISRLISVQKLLAFLESRLHELADAILFYRKSNSVLLGNFGITVICWGFFELVSQYVLLLGFGVQVSPVALIGAIAISWIAGAFSMLPGGIGVMEMVYAIALSQFGVPFEIGFSAVIVYRVLICSLIFLLLIVFFVINDIMNWGKPTSDTTM